MAQPLPKKYRDAVPQSSASPFGFLMRVPVPWVFVLTYLLGVALQRWLPVDIRSRLLPGIGAVLFGVGVVIAAWSLGIFRRARTTTVPGRASTTLVTWGPYRFSRNPMYVSLTLAYLGEAALLAHVWPLVLLPLTLAYVNWIVIPVEEGRLAEVFGPEYERYRAKVRRWV